MSPQILGRKTTSRTFLPFCTSILEIRRKSASPAASEPKLQLVGQRPRYVACLRFNAKKSNGEYAGAEQYMAVFVTGRLDQMVKAKPEECAGAEYRPFPEAETLSR